MGYIPAYSRLWSAVNSKGETELIYGPIFPAFILADLTTYEGFKSLTQWVGLNGFIYLEEKKNIIEELVGVSLGERLQKYWDFPADLERLKKRELKALPDSFIEKFYWRIRQKLLDDQTDVRLFRATYMSEYLREKKPPKDVVEKAIIRILKAFNQHTQYIRVNIKPVNFLTKARLESESKKPQMARRKVFNWELSYESLPARCYMEMIDLIQDEKEVRECQHCREIFIPSRKDEKFCKRIAPEYRILESNEQRTCKQVGPAKKFEKGNEEYRKRYKHYHNLLRYLKKTGQDKEYQKISAEFEQWKIKTSCRDCEDAM